MKINIFQIILGLGMVIAMTISLAWDPTGFYARYMVEPGNWNTVFNPNIREVIATVLAYLVMLFALSIIGVSITLLIKRIRYEYAESGKIQKSVRKLVRTQIVLGLLVAVFSILVAIWGFPTSYTFDIADNLSHAISFMPGPQFVNAMLLSLLTALLGIIILAFGIAQYFRCRYLKNTSDTD
ncbi:hypothetical protein ACFLXY_00610 [Chloroflexota bacterium]